MIKHKHRPKPKQISERKVFTSPGSLIYVGKDVSADVRIRLEQYTPEIMREINVSNIEQDLVASIDQEVTWLSVDGVHDTAVVEAIGKHYQLHSLMLEDILNTFQKPKYELFDEKHVFLILKMLDFDENKLQIIPEHVALILGKNEVLSFQEHHTPDIFQPIINRLKASVGKTRKGKSDYLFFSLMDLVVDNYFVILEELNEQLDAIEAEIIENPSSKSQALLYRVKQQITEMKKHVSPLREAINGLLHEESDFISEKSMPYFRDVYDHVGQVLDTLDSYREVSENMMNVYLSMLSNKMNTVMKTLTVFTALFMPLSFIAGVYGMNFDNMPELHTQTGYYWAMGFMGFVFVGLLVYFRRKDYI